MAVWHSARRALQYVACAVLGSLMLIFLTQDKWSRYSSPTRWVNPFATDKSILTIGGHQHIKDNATRISIVESRGSHDDVWAALMHAFGDSEDSELYLYLKAQRYGSGEIVKGFNLASPIIKSSSVKDLPKAVKQGFAPDILVLTACEQDIVDRNVKNTLETLLRDGTTWLVCVIHHADRWQSDDVGPKIIQDWVAAKRIDFLGLSQHTVDYFVKQSVPKWKVTGPIIANVLPPIFPVAVPKHDHDEIAGLDHFMQVNYQSARQEYRSVFSHLHNIIDKAEGDMAHGDDARTQGVKVHVIGHGAVPHVPKELQRHVVFDHDLAYPEFYAIISESFALLPAFASDQYYDRIASSAIPAALIAGTPIVANERLLKAYTYMPREAVWLAQEGESELEVIERVMENKTEYRMKRALVEKTAIDLQLMNRFHAKQWVDDILTKMKQPS